MPSPRFQFRLSTIFWITFLLPACFFVNPYFECPNCETRCLFDKSLGLTLVVVLSFVLKRHIEKLGRPCQPKDADGDIVE